MFKVITFIGDKYSWEREMASEAQISEYQDYLSQLANYLPRKLKTELGPIGSTCAMEAQIIQIPDPQNFQYLLHGDTFHVEYTPIANPDSGNQPPISNTHPALPGTADPNVGRIPNKSTDASGIDGPRPAVSNQNGPTSNSSDNETRKSDLHPEGNRGEAPRTNPQIPKPKG